MPGRRRELPWFAGSVLALLVLTAVFAALLAPQNPTEGDITQKLIPPIWVEGGDREHPLGTDRFGRDVLSRVIYGSRISLLVSLIAIGVAGTFAVAALMQILALISTSRLPAMAATMSASSWATATAPSRPRRRSRSARSPMPSPPPT